MPKLEKLRKSARGQTCTFQIPDICNHNPETTVLCHIDSEYKGMGIKSPDYIACFGCSACHTHIDSHQLPEIDRLYYTMRGLHRTLRYWFDNGILV